MVSKDNNLRFWLDFPLGKALSRRPLLAICAIALSLAACTNGRADVAHLKSDSSPNVVPAPVDATRSAATSGAIDASSGVQAASTAAVRTIKSCPLPPPGAKPVCNRT